MAVPRKKTSRMKRGTRRSADALTAPGGETWTWGDPASPDRVEGSALDFCLVVTQRRLLADTELTVTGDAAREWMAIAQAFAGGPTTTDPARRSSR